MNDVVEVYNTQFVQQSDGDVETSEPETVIKGASVQLPVSIGDEGEFVREIQSDLVSAGFSLPQYGIDGIFGPETRRAVMRFQKRYGLMVDGLVGSQTLNKLKEVLNTNKPINEFPLPDGILQEGDEGEGVRQVQRALKHLNYDPTYIDGIYGPLTEDAVRRFQSMYSALANDGIYGPNTREFIEMELVDDLS
ncbi:peptidoglycan-binding domain-containing protein [Salirhabdus euzebyi]|uniref:peptidoglycan-binding domain-containing protein n=1 Tax=Salirhabdus euzebyi TaxID=394506 RepID=UPI001FE763A9|nr:peptidoglycan-binding protein [Salirhabdus euzebyi]